MSLYLGIDGGGTKTRVILTDQKNHVLFENTGLASSIDTVSNDQTYQALYDALSPYFDIHQDKRIDACFAGVGGIVFSSDYTRVEALIRKLPYFKDDAIIMARNDMENALYSGYCFDQGITLIAGTGMVAFGKHGALSHKSGGWGYKEGEIGSAFHLGTEAIRYATKAFDGRVEKDAFALEVAEVIGMTKATDIISIMDEYRDQRTKIAGLSPLVTKYANSGHDYAKHIVDVATHECTLAINAVYQNIQIKNPTLVIVGSLGNASGYFKDELHRKVKQIDPNFKIIKPLVDPAIAAAMMASKLTKSS